MEFRQELVDEQFLLIDFLEKNHELLNEDQFNYIAGQINEIEAILENLEYN